MITSLWKVCCSIVNNYTNRWLTQKPLAVSSGNNSILTIETQRTCSYLIGNSGQHAYNGNPPKYMDEENRIKKLHHKMVNELSDEIYPGMGNPWKKLINMLKICLALEEISSATDIFIVCEILERKDEIRYGEYEMLKEIFFDCGLKKCCKIVDKYSQSMQEIQGPSSSVSAADKRRKKMHPSADILTVIVEIDSEIPPCSDKIHLYYMLMELFNKTLLEVADNESRPLEETFTLMERWLSMYERVEVKMGCLVIYIGCSTADSLDNLWQMYRSGKLLEILQTGLVTRDLLTKCEMESIQLKVFIAKEDYERCISNIVKSKSTDTAMLGPSQDAEGGKLKSGKTDTRHFAMKKSIVVAEKINPDNEDTKEIASKIMDSKNITNTEGRDVAETKSDFENLMHTAAHLRTSLEQDEHELFSVAAGSCFIYNTSEEIKFPQELIREHQRRNRKMRASCAMSPKE